MIIENHEKGTEKNALRGAGKLKYWKYYDC